MADSVPLFKKVERFKADLGVGGANARDAILETAACLSIPAHGQGLGPLANACWKVLYGDKDAGSSPAGAGSASSSCKQPDITKDDTVTSMIEKLSLTAGEEAAECGICFDPLHERPVAAFMCGHKRTCQHFFHDDCAAGLINTAHATSKRCPLCNSAITAKVTVPKASADPEGWFKCIDVANDNKVSRAHVMAVLVSQFPIDLLKLEEQMPTLWDKWDKDHSGYLDKREVIEGPGSLLAFVQRALLKEDPAAQAQHVQVLVPPGMRPGQQLEFEFRGQRVRITLPASARPGQTVLVGLPPMPLQPAKQLSMEDPRRWFDHFDPQHTGKLSSHQLLRALCKTNPGLKIDGASALVQRLELVPPGTEQIDYAHFLAIHEILKGALDAGASRGQ
jgi:hypothetical protein